MRLESRPDKVNKRPREPTGKKNQMCGTPDQRESARARARAREKERETETEKERVGQA